MRVTGSRKRRPAAVLFSLVLFRLQVFPLRRFRGPRLVPRYLPIPRLRI